MRLPPLPTTESPAGPSAIAAQLVAEGAAGAAFAVVDWLLEQFPALLNMPMATIRYNGYGGARYTTQTPMLQTLSHFTRSLPYEAIALLDRLLRLGASTQPCPTPLGSQGAQRVPSRCHERALCRGCQKGVRRESRGHQEPESVERVLIECWICCFA